MKKNKTRLFSVALFLSLSLLASTVTLSQTKCVFSVNTIFDSQDRVQKISVFKTTDGVTFSKICDSVPIIPRIKYSAVYFKDRLWIIGGLFVDSNFRNVSSFDDAYSSADGKKWQKEKMSGFPKREGNTIVVYKNEMYSIGGQFRDSFNFPGSTKKYFGGVRSLSVLKTSDGKRWSKIYDGLPFESNSLSFRVFATSNSIFVISDTVGAWYYGIEHRMWSSNDGKKWKDLGRLPSTRYHSGTRFFNGEIYDIGGRTMRGEYPSKIICTGNSSKWNIDSSQKYLPKSSRCGLYVFNNKLYAYINREVFSLNRSNDWRKAGPMTQPMLESPLDDECYHFVEVLNTKYYKTSEVIDIKADVSKSEIKIYPNPATDQITIETTDKGTAEIFDLNGKLVQSVPITESRTVIARNDLPAGMYILYISGNRRKIVFQ
jgi:hypothetical protein